MPARRNRDLIAT